MREEKMKKKGEESGRRVKKLGEGSGRKKKRKREEKEKRKRERK